MTSPVTFVLTLHCHQPVGNFDHVFEEAYERCYRPLAEHLRRHGPLPVSLHFSGPLLEWIEAHRPEYFDELRLLVEEGGAEMVGGAFYEPILTMLPERDAIGQLRLMAETIERRFGRRPRGAWLAERVWEQHLVRVLADAGVEYIALDDTHFHFAGLDDEQLDGPYLTEDEGRMLTVFPAAQPLRHLIPYRDPAETVAFLREAGARAADAGRPPPCLVYADDGEKFGLWPGTHKHVYQDGWLGRFFEALKAESDWLELSTLDEAARRQRPRGLIYLPDASYREMTEWSLPAKALAAYEQALRQADGVPGADLLRRFARGGSWRNFKVKYPEVRRLYAKMSAVSRRVDALPDGAAARDPARRELYRGQCNCPYWHGVFGGLYLPHLRSAVWNHLLRAERLAEVETYGEGDWAICEQGDLDLDGRAEVRLASPRLAATVQPHAGGRITELVARDVPLNLLDTLSRRPETYHAALQAGETGQDSEEVESIHGKLRTKEPGLADHLCYDSYERASLIDHLFTDAGGGGPPAPDAQALAALEESGDPSWIHGEYDLLEAEQAADGARCRLLREGPAGGAAVRIEKEIRLPADRGEIAVDYRVRAAGGGRPLRLGVEWNFALLAGRAPDRYYHTSAKDNAGNLSHVARWKGLDFVGLRDEWLGLDLILRFSRPADVYVHPVETVSQSEAGLERVYQSSVVMPTWPLSANGETAEIGMVLEVVHER